MHGMPWEWNDGANGSAGNFTSVLSLRGFFIIRRLKVMRKQWRFGGVGRSRSTKWPIEVRFGAKWVHEIGT